MRYATYPLVVFRGGPVQGPERVFDTLDGADGVLGVEVRNRRRGVAGLLIVTTEAEDVELYEEQLARWKKLDLTAAQRREVDGLADEIPRIRTLITAILQLADELKGGTIETVLAKSDFEVGLESLLGKRKPYRAAP